MRNAVTQCFLAVLFCTLLVGNVAAASSTPINLATASAKELITIDGIGSVLAQRIVDHRSQSPFGKLADLKQVKGIGEKLYHQIEPRLTLAKAR